MAGILCVLFITSPRKCSSWQVLLKCSVNECTGLPHGVDGHTVLVCFPTATRAGLSQNQHEKPSGTLEKPLNLCHRDTALLSPQRGNPEASGTKGLCASLPGSSTSELRVGGRQRMQAVEGVNIRSAKSAWKMHRAGELSHGVKKPTAGPASQTAGPASSARSLPVLFPEMHTSRGSR